MADAKAGGADLVQRKAADLVRQARRTADLVVDSGHASLVGAHVRARDGVGEIRDRACESADQPLFFAGIDRGWPKIIFLPLPWGSPAAAFFSVIARARRKASAALKSGVIRTSPIDGPQAMLSMTTIARRPRFGL